MAIAASQNTAVSCAGGVNASVQVSATAVLPTGPFGMDPSSTSTVGTAISVAAGVAIAAAQLSGASNAAIVPIVPIDKFSYCENTPNPDISKGSMSFAFLNSESKLLTREQAETMQNGLEQSYNNIFGCIET